jgi:hypothetical protein
MPRYYAGITLSVQESSVRWGVVIRRFGARDRRLGRVVYESHGYLPGLVEDDPATWLQHHLAQVLTDL